jgi:type IV pilus assembly protein PilC
MEFRCRLGTPGGEILEGIYIADNEDRLRRELEEKGLYILSLQRRSGLQSLSLSGSRRGRIGRQEFLVFNQEMATLLKAGMPLVQSLDILRQRITNQTFKAVLDAIYEKVKAGSPLSEAFSDHGSLFPPVYAASLMAGERSGNLDSVIRRYVAYEKVIGTVRKRTISALIYPAILVTMMLVLISIIVLKVVPAFSDFYGNFDRPLPWSTRVIVAVSNAAVANVWFVLIGVIGGVTALTLWVKHPAQRATFHRFLLTLPWFGETIRKFATAQVARTLATLLGGGIPLVNAIEIGGRSMSNRFLARELDDVRRRVQEGQSFAAALRERASFPDVSVKMIEVGESTGALQEMLNSLADFYDEEIETEVSRFITLVEPLILVIMGVIIAMVVLALYMPLFELSSVVGAR